MKKVIAIFFIACFAAGIVACNVSKRSNGVRQENTSTIMDSGAQSKPPTIADTTRQ